MHTKQQNKRPATAKVAKKTTKAINKTPKRSLKTKKSSITKVTRATPLQTNTSNTTFMMMSRKRNFSTESPKVLNQEQLEEAFGTWDQQLDLLDSKTKNYQPLDIDSFFNESNKSAEYTPRDDNLFDDEGEGDLEELNKEVKKEFHSLNVYIGEMPIDGSQMQPFINLQGHFGSLMAPIPIHTPENRQIVGCVGHPAVPGFGGKEHELGWFVMEGLKPFMCPDCDQIFQIKNEMKSPLARQWQPGVVYICGDIGGSAAV